MPPAEVSRDVLVLRTNITISGRSSVNLLIDTLAMGAGVGHIHQSLWQVMGE
jgi:ACT domain-containing protein